MEIEVKIAENGDLHLFMAEEFRQELSDEIEEGARGFWGILADLFESYSCNGSYTPFDAGDGDPFVGLTSAPCIAEGMTVEDDGKRVIEGRFWYFERYAIADPLEELVTSGETIFELAR